MIKGTSKNIICDGCGTIITHTPHETVRGKKRILHYCNTEEKKCNPDNKDHNPKPETSNQ